MTKLSGPYWAYYNQYRELRQKFFNPNNSAYDKFQHLDFDFPTYRSFYQEIVSNVGHRPGRGHEYVLTRQDRSKGYVPGNLVWMTKQQLGNHYQNSRSIPWRGHKISASNYCRKLGINYNRFLKALLKGMTIPEARRHARG